MKHISKEVWALTGIILIFAFWKLSNLHFRFGDENVYFYMTEAISSGLLPYRDFFIADPPVFIFLLTFFKWLIGDNLLVFKAWPVIFDSLSAILIWKILKTQSSRFTLLGPILYLFSFTVLSTSDYVTGAEVTIFFILAALYLSRLSTQYIGVTYASGMIWALACLCKLYAAPALIGFLAYKTYQKQFEDLKRIIIGGVITTVVVLLPFIIIAPKELLYDLIQHQFNRPAGLNKWTVWGFFVSMEWALLLLGLIGAFITKHKALALQLALSGLFFIFYRDLYFLYLHILIPYLVLLAVESIETIKGKFGAELSAAALILYALASLYPIITFATVTTREGIFNHPREVAEALAQIPDNLPVYGIQEVAPLVALFSGKSIFDNVIDTNTQNFAAHTHDKRAVSEAAVKNGIYLISRGASELYFDQTLFDRYCIKYKSLPQQIEIHRCKN